MLVITPVSNSRYQLLQEFVTPYGAIPKGYETNGADIPFVFKPFTNKYDPQYIDAVVVHDYFWEIEMYDYANDCFCEMLRKKKMGIKGRLMCFFVKLYKTLAK